MQWIVCSLGGKPRLADWVNRPFSPSVEHGPRARDRRDCFERVVAVEPPGEPVPDGPFRCVARSIFAYEIFPPTLVTPVLHRTPLQLGDTVGALFHLIPGLDIFCASRVIACFDEARGGVWHSGFTYRTLAGHPELGEETFSVEKDMTTGTVVAALRSWSRPGTWLTWLGSPYTRRTQVRANNAALIQLAAVAAGSSTDSLPNPGT